MPWRKTSPHGASGVQDRRLWAKAGGGPGLLDVVSARLAGVGCRRVPFAPPRVTPAALAAEERPADDEQTRGGPSDEQGRPELKPGARNKWHRFK